MVLIQSMLLSTYNLLQKQIDYKVTVIFSDCYGTLCYILHVPNPYMKL